MYEGRYNLVVEGEATKNRWYFFWFILLVSVAFNSTKVCTIQLNSGSYMSSFQSEKVKVASCPCGGSAR